MYIAPLLLVIIMAAAIDIIIPASITTTVADLCAGIITTAPIMPRAVAEAAIKSFS